MKAEPQLGLRVEEFSGWIDVWLLLALETLDKQQFSEFLILLPCVCVCTRLCWGVLLNSMQFWGSSTTPSVDSPVLVIQGEHSSATSLLLPRGQFDAGESHQVGLCSQFHPGQITSVLVLSCLKIRALEPCGEQPPPRKE